MADGQFTSVVSKDRNANALANPIWVNLSDGTTGVAIDGSGFLTVNVNGTITVSASDLDIRDLLYTQDSILIYGNTAKDGSGTDYVPLLDADGKIIISNPGGTEYTEDAVAPAAATGITSLVERDDALGGITPAEGDWSKLYCNANGALWIKHDGDINIADGGNTITVDGTVAATQSGVWDIGTVTTLTGITNDVNIADGGNTITVDAVALDIRTITKATDSIQVSANTAVNSETNPIYTYQVNTVVSGSEIHDYDVATAIASDASSNHDYTVAGTTFLLKSVILSGSGNIKGEIQVGPLASLATKAVVFLQGREGDTKQVDFNPAIEVPATSTGTVRIIKTNRQGAATDLYSTIIGNDVA